MGEGVGHGFRVRVLSRGLMTEEPPTRGRFCVWPQVAMELGDEAEAAEAKRGSATRSSWESVTGETSSSSFSSSSSASLSGTKQSNATTTLGYVTLQAPVLDTPTIRECKTIHLATLCSHVKLYCFAPHVHPLNTYNQVGILDLLIYGEAQRANGQLPSVSSSLPRTFEADPIVDGILDADPYYLHGDGRRDPVIAPLLQALQDLKVAAVRHEDFRVAAQCKHHLQTLESLQHQAAVLESQKASAIYDEDYEGAEHLKRMIAQLRGDAEEVVVAFPQVRGYLPQPPAPLSYPLGDPGMTMPARQVSSSLPERQEQGVMEPAPAPAARAAPVRIAQPPDVEPHPLLSGAP